MKNLIAKTMFLFLYAALPGASEAQPIVMPITYGEFRSLAEELAPKVTVFREVWKLDSSAEFFGGTSRDYLYWLRKQFRAPMTREVAFSTITRLREMPVIDVREFIVHDSDIDVVSNEKEFDLAAEDFGIKRFDFSSKDRFQKDTELGRNEVMQGFAPVEKIRLGQKGFIDSEHFKDGVREIYDGRPTVVFASASDFDSTYYARKNLNHPILLALRYIRLLSANYFYLYGNGYPDIERLLDVDPTSEKVVRTVIEAAAADGHTLEDHIRQETFRGWIDGTIQKAFRSYTNPTAARALFAHFGAEKIVAIYNLTPINQYLFAKKYDAPTVESAIASAGFTPKTLFTPAEQIFGSDLIAFHGTKTRDMLRSILFEGVIASKHSILAPLSNGNGFYVFPAAAMHAMKHVIEDAEGKEELIVNVKIRSDARVVDQRRPEIMKLGLTPDEIADRFGADILVYDKLLVAGYAAVIKNSAVIEKITGKSVSLMPVSEILSAAKKARTATEMSDILKAASMNNLLDYESNTLVQDILRDQVQKKMLMLAADRAVDDPELRKSIVRIFFSNLRDQTDLIRELGAHMMRPSPNMSFDDLIMQAITKDFDRPRDLAFDLYGSYMENVLLPSVAQMPFEKLKKYLDVLLTVTRMGNNRDDELATVGGTPLVNSYGHWFIASKGVSVRLGLAVFKAIVMPHLSASDPYRSSALEMAEQIFSREYYDGLFEEFARYFTRTRDFEFLRRMNAQAANSLSSRMPSQWLTQISTFTPDLRVKAFADFAEQTWIVNRDYRGDTYLRDYLVKYEYERKQLPMHELDDIRHLLRTRLQEAKSPVQTRALKSAVQETLTFTAHLDACETLLRAP